MSLAGAVLNAESEAHRARASWQNQRPPVSRTKGLAVNSRTWLYPALPPAILTLALCVYILRLPNVLYGTNQYDDGVYMGAALRLVHGVVPYRDFVMVHPPGIVLLMAPIAFLGKFAGSNVALALGRDMTAAVAALNVILVAAVVRHRGRIASLVASTAMACFPMAAASDSTLFLEPYLILFCLAGLALLFSKGQIAPTRRVVMAGLAIGFAGTVKVWAAFIVVAAAAVCIRRVKSALLPLIAASATGFALPCLPFFALAPRSFLRNILGDQFSRAVRGGAPVSWIVRLIRLTGMEAMTLFRPTTLGVVIVVVGFALAVLTVLAKKRQSLVPADWMVLSGTVVTIGALWLPHEMYSHYVYFSAPFLAMLLALAVSEGLGMLPFRDLRNSSRMRAVVAIVGCAAVAAFLLPQQAGYARSNLAGAKDATFLNLFVPPHSCILTDNVEPLISADLFQPQRKGCPAVTDSFGVWLADGPAGEPSYSGTSKFGSTVEGPFSSSFVNRWAGWLDDADYVVTMAQYSGYIPWTSQLALWFNANFKVTYQQFGLWIYQHVGKVPPPVAA